LVEEGGFPGCSDLGIFNFNLGIGLKVGTQDESL
jgi:hypothetical protein